MQFQIVNQRGEYYSRNMHGAAMWINNKEFGYLFSLEEARKLVTYLNAHGHDVHIQKY